MGAFRTLSADDVRGLLAAFGLGDYQRHQGVAAGTINTNASVDAGGRRYFLRINEGKSADEVAREAAIVAHLAARGVPTPAPITARDGRPFWLWSDVCVSLFPWVEGRTLRRCDLRPAQARDAGRALARLHLAGADFADHRPGRYQPDEIARRLRRVADAGRRDAALSEAAAVLEPELEALARERRPDLPRGLIHHDLFIDNVLYDAAGSLVAVLDFEQAAWGKLGYDVAVALLAFGFGIEDFDPERTRAFLDGYREGRAPAASEIEAFGTELRFAACRFTVTRITDVHLRREAGAPAGKDFARYLLRLRRIREHLERDDGLLAL